MKESFKFRNENFGILGYNVNKGDFLLPKNITFNKVLNRKLSSPLFLVWEITNKCNLNCLHCSNENKEKDLSLNQCFKIIESINKEHIFHVNISGGEPFLRKDLFHILKRLKENEISFDIYSNGTLIDPNIISNLKLIKPKRVFLSLDGLEKTHNFIRRKKCFDRVVKSLKMLKKAKINTGVTITLMKNNIKELDNLIKFLIKNKIENLMINDLMPSGNAKEDYLKKRLNKQELKKAVNIISRYKKYLNIDSEVLIDFSFKKTYKNSFCGVNRFVARVTNDGKLTPCSFINENYGPMLKINFQKDFWNNRNLLKLNKLNKKCTDCINMNYCNGGCRAISEYLNGKKSSIDPRCFY